MISALLKQLRVRRGGWVLIEALQSELGCSAAAIHQAAEQLRQVGLAVECVPPYGLRLAQPVERLTSELVECGLETRRLGRRVLVYDTTDSTNDIAWQYAGEAGTDGLVVLAEQQRRGRGRLGRSWSAVKGAGLLISVLLKGDSPALAVGLSLAAGLAVVEAVEGVCHLRCRIQWPNDVMIRGRKLAGVMVEARARRATKENSSPATEAGTVDYVVGIGINCHQRADDFPPVLREKAASLGQFAEWPVDRLHLTQALLQTLEQWCCRLEQGDVEALHDRWLAHSDDLGRVITVARDGQVFTGRVIDIHPYEGLLLRCDAGPALFFDPLTTSVVKE